MATETAYFGVPGDVPQRSARAMLPFVLRVAGAKAVVDVGCGTGEWLAAARECGVQRLLGIDSHQVARRPMRIDAACFRCMDLKSPQPLDDVFDLALCLEVIEHIPQDRSAGFLDWLATLAPVILFSGAIPFQGGIGHVNEQWPDHWLGEFQRRGFRACD